MANQNFRVKNGLEVGGVEVVNGTGVVNSTALPASGASAGTYGNSTSIPVVTVTAKGIVTNVQSAAVSGVSSFVYTAANTTFVLGTGDGTTYAQTIVFDGDGFVSNSSGIHLELDGGTLLNGSSGLSVNAAALNHDLLNGYVANEHIDHSSVSTIAGNGLTGGGTLEANRTLAINSGDSITIANSTGLHVNTGAIDITSLNNFVANKYIDHTSVTMTAGAGMTGGGAINTTRTFNVVADDTSIVVTADGISVNAQVIDHTTLSGYDVNENIDHTGVTMTAGGGLSGGGTIASTRTFAVGAGDGMTVNADDVAVKPGTGIASNSTGVHFLAGLGLGANSTTVKVLAGTGVVSNTSGVHIGQPVGTANDVTFRDMVISGNLTVQGTQTTISTETLTVDDNIIVLNNNETGTPSEDAGIEVERGTSTNVKLQWDEGTDKWQVTEDGSAYYDLRHKGVAIALDTDTSGNFVDNVTVGSGLSVSGTPGAGWEPSLAVVPGTGITANSTGVFTNDSQIVHDSLSGFVANEHIDHSSVSITAGNGLTGGGNITATRNIAVTGGTGVTSNSTGVHIGQSVGTTDNVTFNDVTISANAIISSLQDSSNRVLKVYNSSGSLIWG
tara:strand:- start:20385 stop:22226 length:1842 start_codon:yes stop_codon:yes gene_type:complete